MLKRVSWMGGCLGPPDRPVSPGVAVSCRTQLARYVPTMAHDVLLWFKRDLRVQDNPALAEAVARGERVLPLFVVEPDAWTQTDASARQFEFLSECLEGLRADLGRLGAPLLVRAGAARDVLASLCAETGIREIVSHEETGNAWSYARDRSVAGWARAQGIRWIEVPQMGVVRRLDTRNGWAARRERVMRGSLLPEPMGLRRFEIDPGPIPTPRDLSLEVGTCPGRQPGGRADAELLLTSFLSTRGQTYRRAMSSPLEGEAACSRLSPHLAWGTFSPREVTQAAAGRKARAMGTREGWTGSMKSFEARLAWRDHFMQKLEDAPAIETECLHRAYEGLRPRTPDAVRLAAWERGETGIPFVDACMRYLIHGGWLNFRMRAMLVAVASYHLWLDWRATGPHLARMFTDYEPGIHWPQVQMQSGTTGMNTVRIYNPIKQGQDHDAEGVFTRRWLPELAEVPDRYLQRPWEWERAGQLLGRRYPEPVVEVAVAAREARAKVWAVRRGEAFRDEAARIVEKHASRKESGAGRHFVNDRERRRPKGDRRQLSLDL